LLTPPLLGRRGFPQGAPTSFSLFNLFIDSLFDLLNSAPDLKTLAYADDLACLAHSAPNLQAGPNTASRRASEWGMRFNVTKCAVLAPPDLTDSVFSLTLAGEVVPVLPSFRYLHIPHSATSLDYFTLVDKVASLECSLRALQAVGTAWPPRTHLTLLKTFSLSHLDFGGAILHLALTLFPSLSTCTLDRLTAVHNSTTRWVMDGLVLEVGGPTGGLLDWSASPHLCLQQLALGLALHVSEADHVRRDRSPRDASASPELGGWGGVSLC
ncbi:hypothetical protein JCM5296_000835, partial [Sporobolomyces johnsonii]